VYARPRVYFALSFLAAGVVLAPLVPTDSQPIDWQAMSQAYEEPIFSDGFEDGSTLNWSVTITGTAVKVVLAHGSKIAEEILLSIDEDGRGWVPTALFQNGVVDERRLAVGPITQVDDCTVRIAQNGVIVTFSLPLD